MMLWSYEELITLFGSSGVGSSLKTGIDSVAIDSRLVTSQGLFVALPGTNYDGHNFVANAISAGAAGSIVARAIPDFEDRLIIVRDPYKALCQLAQAARQRCSGKIIAITGSVGKTTTKHILQTLLAAQSSTVASAKSYNNYTGVPLSLAHLHRDTEYGIFEMGMNNAGEITPLSEMVRPHITVITNIAPAHIENLGSIENIAKAKAEIFSGLEAGGVAILPRDSEQYELLAAEAHRYGVDKIITFGMHPEANIQCVGSTTHPDRSEVEVKLFNIPIKYTLSLPGAHHVINSLAALAAVYAVGADMNKAVEQMTNITLVEGRGRYHQVPWKKGKLIVIDETYNANPVAVMAALKVLEQTPTSGRRIAILGDMRELGEYAEELHQSLVPVISNSNIDMVHTCGQHMATVHELIASSKRGLHTNTSSELVASVCGLLEAGDTVMIKGSRGMRMETILSEILKGQS